MTIAKESPAAFERFVLAGFFAALFSSVHTTEAQAEKVPVQVRTVQETAIGGQLKSLSFDNGLQLDVDGEAKHIETDDLITIQRTEFSPGHGTSPWPSLEHEEVGLELVNGDRIAGQIGSGTDSISLTTQDWGVLSAPMEQVSTMLFSAADLPAFADSLRWFRRKKDATNDRVLLTNGDVAEGFITAVSRDGLRLEVGDDTTTIPLRLAVAAQVIHPPASPPGMRHAVLTLVDGQRLTLTEMSWKASKVRGKTANGEFVEPPSDRIESVAFEGGRWEWLSAKSPLRSEHTPMLGMEFKPVMDRNVLGGELRVGGGVFQHGFGVHSKSTLTFELSGAYKELVTSFGMDDDSGTAANVQVVIRVDGQQRFEKSDIAAGTLHGPVRIDVAGARQLELSVDFGKNGDIQDRFDWIEPGLVK